ncbi:MAG TPA: hypothetical protein VN085_09520 [Vicinamibacterales bacterium]|nr:hypothetical protein [Vicinamibacterales bacterium]
MAHVLIVDDDRFFLETWTAHFGTMGTRSIRQVRSRLRSIR